MVVFFLLINGRENGRWMRCYCADGGGAALRNLPSRAGSWVCRPPHSTDGPGIRCRSGWPAKSNRIKATHRSPASGVWCHKSVESFGMEKQPKPVTCCTVCGKVGYSINLANGLCGRRYDGKRCRGVNQSAIGVNDWSECPSCTATGWEGNSMCHPCNGSGWIFVRG